MNNYNILEANKVLVGTAAWLARDMAFDPERKPMGWRAQRNMETRVEGWREGVMKLVHQHQSAHVEINRLKSRLLQFEEQNNGS